MEALNNCTCEDAQRDERMRRNKRESKVDVGHGQWVSQGDGRQEKREWRSAVGELNVGPVPRNRSGWSGKRKRRPNLIVYEWDPVYCVLTGMGAGTVVAAGQNICTNSNIVDQYQRPLHFQSLPSLQIESS